MIKSADISVVIQGAIDYNIINKVINSIKKNLPDAEIILSTWQGTNLNGINYDKVILNKDIGAVPFRLNGQLHNLNRQIYSTFNGIKLVKRKYTLKIRSDIMLLNTNFLKYFDKFPIRDNKYKIFSNRILITNIYTRKASYKFKALFHPSDWIMFGLTTDLYKMWNIPLAKEPETSQWYKTHKKPYKDIFPDFLTRYHAEQYIWINALKTNGINISFNNYSSYSRKLALISNKTIFNNFVVMDYLPKFSFLNIKYPNVLIDDTIISYYEWIKYYKQNYDSSFKIPFCYLFLNDLKIKKNFQKLKKHFKNFIFPIKKIIYYIIIFFKWISEIFSIIFYIIKIPIDIIFRINKIFNR